MLSLVAMLALLLAFAAASTPPIYAAGSITVSTTNDVVVGNTRSITALTCSPGSPSHKGIALALQ